MRPASPSDALAPCGALQVAMQQAISGGGGGAGVWVSLLASPPASALSHLVPPAAMTTYPSICRSAARPALPEQSRHCLQEASGGAPRGRRGLERAARRRCLPVPAVGHLSVCLWGQQGHTLMCHL